MSSEWTWLTVKEIASPAPNALATGPFGSSISSKYFQEHGVPVIRGSNLSTDTGIRFSDENLVFISQEKAKELHRSKVKKGDLIFTCWGTINQVGYLDGSTKYSEYIISNKQMKLTADLEKANPAFLYYVFSSTEKQKEILSNGIGAAVPGFNLGQLKAHKVFLPPLKIQNQIAETLGELDKKIELNRQTNQTLEQIAQAIFKSWFVDFDPVKAKIWANENGHDPERAAMCALAGLPYADDALDHLSPEQQQQLATTAALFPNSLEESELGEIPSGWSIGSLKDCCTRVESGGTPKRSEDSYWSGDIPWLTSGEVRDVIVLDTKEKISQTGLENSSAKIWPEFTTVVAMYGATAGQTCLLANPMTANQACCALIPKEGYSTFIFISARNATEDFLGKASGSAQQNLNKSLVSDHQTLLPNADVMRAFEARIAGNIRLWIQLAKECITLSTLRDTLLPKLLSGELSVADLSEVAEIDTGA